MNITAKTKINMVIGDPVGHSIGPQVYNAVYKEVGIDDQFVYVAAGVKPHNLKNAMNGIRAFGIRSASITVPHKTAVMEFLDEIDETAIKIGAVNTVINNNGKLRGYNTDWLGIVNALETVTEIARKKIAIIGAGGAARSAVFGLMERGGMVTIFNRTPEKAKELAHEFGCEFASLADSNAIQTMDIIFNATSVGLHPHTTVSPLSKDVINKNHIVFDAVYSPFETQLLKDAKAQGATVIHGLEMFLYQGLEQYKLAIGIDAPIAIIKKELFKYAK